MKIKPIKQWSTVAKVILVIVTPTAVIGAYLIFQWLKNRKGANVRTAGEEEPQGGGGGGGYAGDYGTGSTVGNAIPPIYIGTNQQNTQAPTGGYAPSVNVPFPATNSNVPKTKTTTVKPRVFISTRPVSNTSIPQTRS